MAGLFKCTWCGKNRRQRSAWEQQHVHTGEWLPLCAACAHDRLRHPWNALLPLRKTDDPAKNPGA